MTQAAFSASSSWLLSFLSVWCSSSAGAERDAGERWERGAGRPRWPWALHPGQQVRADERVSGKKLQQSDLHLLYQPEAAETGFTAAALQRWDFLKNAPMCWFRCGKVTSRHVTEISPALLSQMWWLAVMPEASNTMLLILNTWRCVWGLTCLRFPFNVNNQ